MVLTRNNYWSLLFAIIYFLHFTILQVFMPDLTALFYVTIGGLSLFALGSKRKNLVVVPLIVASIISLIMSEDLLAGTYLRWITWIFVILLFGPVFFNIKLVFFRDKLWNYIMYSYVLIAIISFFWILFKLPSYGVDERFTGDGKYFRNGFVSHEMILAPVAALSSIFALYKLLYDHLSRFKNTLMIIVFFISISVIFMASSRTCILATALIILMILIDTRKRLFYGFKNNFSFYILILIGIFILISINTDSINDFFTTNTRLEDKGLDNSREGLWVSRWIDFNKNPLTGVGFYSVSDEVLNNDMLFTGVSDKETGRVEFGSLYLQTLSTMGIIGMLALLYLFYKTYTHYRSRRYLPKASLYFYIFIFFSIHSITESYFFSAGSIFCIFYWLTIAQIFTINKSTIDSNAIKDSNFQSRLSKQNF